MIAFFDPEEIAKIMGLQGLNVRGIGTQTVFGHDELEVWVVLAQLGNKAFGGVTFTIILVRPIMLHDRFGHERNHFTHVRMDDRCAQHLMRIRDRPIAMHLVQTRGTVNSRRGKIPRAIEGQEVVALEKYHRFQRLAALELPRDACVLWEQQWPWETPSREHHIVQVRGYFRINVYERPVQLTQ